jgi:hypothetical protein
MTMGKGAEAFVRDAVIAAVVAFVGAIALKYNDIPARVSVVESQINGVQDTAKSMDHKIDILLARTK